MNKKIDSEVAIGIIVLGAIVFGGLIWRTFKQENQKKVEMSITQSTKPAMQLEIQSDNNQQTGNTQESQIEYGTLVESKEMEDLIKNSNLKERVSFNNKNFNYFVKHPANWKIDNTKLDNVTFGLVSFEPSPGFVSILVTNLEAGDSLEEFVGGFNNVIVKEKTNISGVIAYKLVYQEPFSGGEEESYIFEKNNNIFQIYFMRAQEDFNEICREIIKSFKFVE